MKRCAPCYSTNARARTADGLTNEAVEDDGLRRFPECMQKKCHLQKYAFANLIQAHSDVCRLATVPNEVGRTLSAPAITGHEHIKEYRVPQSHQILS